jgi:hypothetical protein
MPRGLVGTKCTGSAIRSDGGTLGSDALLSDGGEALIGGVDALGVETDGLCFVHAVSMAEIRWEVKRQCALCQASHSSVIPSR